MLRSTKDAVRAVLTTDPTVSPEDRANLLALLNGAGAEKSPAVRIMRRQEVAEMLSVSTRTVDNLAASGALHKVHFPGRKLASGFRSDDVARLLDGKAA